MTARTRDTHCRPVCAGEGLLGTADPRNRGDCGPQEPWGLWTPGAGVDRAPVHWPLNPGAPEEENEERNLSVSNSS